MGASRVVIDVELGNDAMATWEDVARLLERTAVRITREGLNAKKPAPFHSFTMRDDNGNTVARINAE